VPQYNTCVCQPTHTRTYAAICQQEDSIIMFFWLPMIRQTFVVYIVFRLVGPNTLTNATRVFNGSSSMICFVVRNIRLTSVIQKLTAQFTKALSRCYNEINAYWCGNYCWHMCLFCTTVYLTRFLCTPCTLPLSQLTNSCYPECYTSVVFVQFLKKANELKQLRFGISKVFDMPGVWPLICLSFTTSFSFMNSPVISYSAI
jgi:hypothetical protein